MLLERRLGESFRKIHVALEDSMGTSEDEAFCMNADNYYWSGRGSLKSRRIR